MGLRLRTITPNIIRRHHGSPQRRMVRSCQSKVYEPKGLTMWHQNSRDAGANHLRRSRRRQGLSHNESGLLPSLQGSCRIETGSAYHALPESPLKVTLANLSALYRGTWNAAHLSPEQLAKALHYTKTYLARQEGSHHDQSGSSESNASGPAGSQLARARLQQQGNRRSAQHQPAHRQAASPDPVSTRRHPRRPETRETGHRHVHQGGGAIMTPRERPTPKEIQIAILVWEGLTNREIGRIVGTTEQVIKNHLRSTFDKLGVWSRLELAMYVASHGGK